LELVVLGFEGNNFRGEIAPAIEEAQRSGAIRVVDLILARKSKEGDITALEIEEADESYSRNFGALKADIRGLLTEEDAITLADLLPANTAALVILFEHTWATKISEAVRRAGGEMLASQRISRKTIEEIEDELEELMSAPARQ
jgi:hypothetical protein